MTCLIPYARTMQGSPPQSQPPSEPAIRKQGGRYQISLFTSPNDLEKKLSELQARMLLYLQGDPNRKIRSCSQILAKGRAHLTVTGSSSLTTPQRGLRKPIPLLCLQNLGNGRSPSPEIPSQNTRLPQKEASVQPSKSSISPDPGRVLLGDLASNSPLKQRVPSPPPFSAIRSPSP